LEAKARGLTSSIAPYVDRLGTTGLWIMGETRQRILKLAGEADTAPEPKLIIKQYIFTTRVPACAADAATQVRQCASKEVLRGVMFSVGAPAYSS
jgi:hypothetical protein